MAKVVIIGGGPAGVSSALYTVRAGLETTIVASGIGALEKAHLIQNYYGFPDGIAGADLAKNGIEAAKNAGVCICHDQVTGITFEDSLVVEAVNNRLAADYVVIATGTERNASPIKNLKSLEGKGVSCCAVCDGFFYKGKSVAVLGSGEFALHELQELLPIVGRAVVLTNGEPVTGTFPRGVEIITEKITEVLGEEKLQGVLLAGGRIIELNGLFVAQGVAGSTALAKKIGAETEGNIIAVNENMETSIPGLYAAGDCTGGVLQVAKAVYQGAVAGMHIVAQSRNQ